MSNPSVLPSGIHRLAVFLAGYVVLLITAGGLVKSLEAGLSVPDWPLSYGMLNPPRWWEIETVRAEHGHRLIAGVALILTVVLTVWIARKEERSWVRKLAYLALVAVLAQAALGGITVLFYLPTAISVSHAGLAQAFLVLVVTLAVVTSRFWLSRRESSVAGVDAAGLVALTTATTVLIYLQILVGAVMRHIGAGLAIPDFPLVFGGLIPPKLDFAIGIHYTHRMGALLVATLIFWTLGRVLRLAAKEPALSRPAVALAALVLAQGTLGGLVVWTSKAVLPNTLHVGTGALLIATSAVLTLASRRLAWLVDRQPIESPTPPVEMLGAERATP
jgi:cytochrome c oxidase assembly protein subunit 15